MANAAPDALAYSTCRRQKAISPRCESRIVVTYATLLHLAQAFTFADTPCSHPTQLHLFFAMTLSFPFHSSKHHAAVPSLRGQTIPSQPSLGHLHKATYVS